MIRTLFALSLLLSTATAARAATLEGVTLPDTYQADGQTLALNGIALRTLTIFNVKVYVAGLYLAQPSHDAQHILQSTTPKVVLLHYLHSGSKADVEKEYREGEATNCGAGGCDPGDKADFDRLVAAAPAVKPGDTSTFIITNRGLRVLANNQLIGDYNDRDLAFRILLGFIGPKPPSPAVKNALLGMRG